MYEEKTEFASGMPELGLSTKNRDISESAMTTMKKAVQYDINKLILIKR